jgi:hypothetical protein
VEEKDNRRWKKRGRRSSPRPSKIRWRREEELAADLASSPQPCMHPSHLRSHIGEVAVSIVWSCLVVIHSHV